MFSLVLQKAKRWCDDDDEFDDDLLSLENKGSSSAAAVPPRDKPSRARKPVTYQILNSDSEDDF